MKKPVAVFLIIIVLLILAIWSPWETWNFSLYDVLGVEQKQELSALKIYSLAGKLDIYLDDEYLGSAEAESGFAEFPSITPGEHVVRLERVDQGLEYQTLVRKLNFETGVEVVIGYELGPSKEFSEGHILYAKESFSDSDTAILDILSTPAKIKVSLDGQDLGATPLQNIELSVDSRHKLTFSQEGYDTLEIELLPEDQAARDKLRNLVLTLEVNLFAQPINVTKE